MFRPQSIWGEPGGSCHLGFGSVLVSSYGILWTIFFSAWSGWQMCLAGNSRPLTPFLEAAHFLGLGTRADARPACRQVLSHRMRSSRSNRNHQQECSLLSSPVFFSFLFPPFEPRYSSPSTYLSSHFVFPSCPYRQTPTCL